VLGGLEQVLGGEHVVARVELEPLAPAGPHPRLGGQVKGRVTLTDEVVQRSPRQVDGHELESVPIARDVDVAQLLGAAVVVVEAVHSEHLDAVGQQRFGEVRADEARASGHECTHRGIESHGH
jgi:hypothetical protein